MILKEKEEKLKTLAKASALLDKNYHHKDQGTDLQLLSPLLKILSLVTAAQTMEQGSAALLLGTNLGLMGIYSEESSAGFVGKTLQQIVQQLTGGLLSPLMWEPTPDEGHQLLFKNIVATTLIGSAIVGSLIAGNGKKSDESSEQIQSLTAQIALLFIGETHVLTTTYKNLLLACGANDNTKDQLAEILSLCSLLLMVLVVARKRKNVEKILETIKPTAVQSLAKVEHLLTDALAAKMIVGGIGSSLLIATQQCKLALENEEASEVLEAIKMALEAIQQPFDGLNNDLREIENIANLYYANCIAGLGEKSNIDTGITAVYRT